MSSMLASSRVRVARPAHASPAIRGPSSVVAAPRPFVQHSQQLRRRSTSCNGLFGLGLPELAVIAGVAVLIWGPSKLPELGKGLGKTVKSFQGAAKEFESELKAAASEEPAKVEEPKKKDP